MKDIGEEGDTALDTDEEPEDGDGGEEWEGEGSGAWVPGQGVVIDYTAIMDIIIQHLSYPGGLLILTAEVQCADSLRRARSVHSNGVDLDLLGLCPKYGHFVYASDRSRHLAKPGFTTVRLI